MLPLGLLHVGIWQHWSRGSVVSVQFGVSGGYVGHLSSQVILPVIASSHLHTLSQPWLNVWPCLRGIPWYTQKFVEGVGFGPGVGVFPFGPGVGVALIGSGFLQHGLVGSYTR